MHRRFRERYGPWGLVAGGSTGLGAAYAGALARRGLDLILVAEAADPLARVAAETSDRFGVEARAIVADLADAGAVASLLADIDELDVGMVVANAAAAPIGPFLATTLADKQRAIAVNCSAPMRLCDHYAPRLVRRGAGAIVVMSSLAALQGQALVGTYAATKAFDLVLAESLWAELGEHGVDVLAVCPGPTRTPGFAASLGERTQHNIRRAMSAEAVVEAALASLGRGPVIVPGGGNRIAAFALRHLLSRRQSVRLVSRATRSLYG